MGFLKKRTRWLLIRTYMSLILKIAIGCPFKDQLFASWKAFFLQATTVGRPFPKDILFYFHTK